jgi:uridine phosphorylase
MMYPIYKNKYKEEAHYNPINYIDYELKNKKINIALPQKYILIYNLKILTYFRKKYKPQKTSIYSLLTIYKYLDVGVVLMTGIGSAHAVTVMEELIALGGKEFINMGSAGGLKDFGVFLCEKSIRDEGTSYHYVAPQKYAYPDKELTESFECYMRKNSIDFKKGVSWTLDALYRETKAEVEKYKEEGVVTVEMESSALFAVAKYRAVKMAAAFVVTDLLGEKKWQPKFETKKVRLELFHLFETALECLEGRKNQTLQVKAVPPLI